MDELPILNNIIESIIIDNSDDHKYLAELRECIYILIEEFLYFAKYDGYVLSDFGFNGEQAIYEL